VSRARLVSFALLAVLAAGGTGCRVAYIPGEQPVAAPASDPKALRRAVHVMPSTCTAREARATVLNRSAKTLDVTVAVAWATRSGGSVTAKAAVTAAPGKETPVAVRAPDGATADVGCQASASEVTVGR
jgi:hypothetical protein